jgi:hypothetical protein
MRLVLQGVWVKSSDSALIGEWANINSLAKVMGLMDVIRKGLAKHGSTTFGLFSRGFVLNDVQCSARMPFSMRTMSATTHAAGRPVPE